MTDMTYHSSNIATLTQPRTSTRLFTGLALTAILLLAIFLHFYGLDNEGYANAYYAATVRSMLTSPQNFFFASFDPGGFVTVDKPPLGFWIQAISAWVFGYSGWALLFPQALAGVLSVALLFYLVQRVFGSLAGLLAALVLTVTPISIAANRNNTMDSTLVFTLLLAAWAVTLASESGKLRWLLLSMFLVGLGFNIKMLQAFMVLPAFYAIYFFTAPISWLKRVLNLTLATSLLAVVSLAWPLVVDLTPADQRPFIGSSHNNTVMELITGHNGTARLGVLAGLINGGQPPADGQPITGNQPDQPFTGNQPGPNNPPPVGQNGPLNPNQNQPFTGHQPGPNNPPPVGQNGPLNPNQGLPPTGGLNGGQPTGPNGQRPQGPGGPGGLSQETGDVGILRLFNQQLVGQASWLLPLALIGLGVVVLSYKWLWPVRREHQQAILWGLWLIPQVVFFSFAGLFHRYYLEMLSPAIAVLVGVGLACLWQAYRNGHWAGWALPILLLASAIFEAVLVAYFPDWVWWLAPLMIGLAMLGAAGLLVARGFEQGQRPVFSSIALSVAVMAVLLAPTVWSFTPVLAQGDAGLPFAGPELLQRQGRGPQVGVVDSQLLDYLMTHRSGEKYLLATNSANQAAPFIIATGEPVMAMGGFSGGDQILTADTLAQLVAAGEVRFFLISADRRGNGDLNSWITRQCAPVPASAWGASTIGNPTGPGSNNGPGPNGGQTQLYDCKP